jgi:proline iminopeptidase
MRPYLPLQLLAERYRVVFWDMRGNGLSERVSREELSYANMVEEFHAIKQLFSPHRKAAIIAHSWSAVFGAIYLGKYPEDIEQAVLMEPFGLRDTFMNNVGQALNLGSEGYMDMMYSSELITPREHESLDFRMLGMLTSGVRDYFCDRENPPDWPVWRVGGLALLVWEKALLDGTAYHYDFTTGAENYDGEVLFAGSSCSPIGYAFQEKCNQRVFRNAHVLRIEDCGHRLVTEQFDVLVQGLKGFLREYRRGAR